MPTWIIYAAPLVGLLGLLPAPWQRLRHLTTIIHESGHALVGTITGGHLVGVVLRPDASGETLTRHRSGLAGTLFSQIPTLLAGYPAPAFFGAAALVAALGSNADGGWALLGLLGLLCLLFARSLFTVLIAGSYVAIAVLMVPTLGFLGVPVGLSSLILSALATLMIGGALRDLVTLTKITAFEPQVSTDARTLASRSLVLHAWVWVVVLWVLTVAAGIVGGWASPYLTDGLATMVGWLASLFS